MPPSIDDAFPEIPVSFDTQTDLDNLSRTLGTNTAKTERVIKLFEEADAFFFKKREGKIFLNTFSFYMNNKSLRYENYFKLGRGSYAHNSKSIEKNIALTSEYKDFIDKRNRQIRDVLEQNGKLSPSKTTKQQADITTQRTAEEIKMLVENLDPQNPLRRAIEHTLQVNGYIAPEK